MKHYVKAFLSLLFASLSVFAYAQNATPDSGQVSKTTKGIPIETPYVDFKLSGGIYLYDYLPLMPGATNNFSIYAFVLKTDAETKDKLFGLHVETRFRDTKLRPFFNSNIWFQEAYAWAHTDWGDVHAGKIYKKVGFFWDGSFFGNVQYFNGLKLNPEFGTEFVGSKQAGDAVKIDYSLQYISNNDQVDGALAGRDVESDTNARFQNGVTARFAPTFKLADGVSLTLGISGLTSTIHRIKGPDFQMNQLAGDFNLNVGNASLMGEILGQQGEADDAAHPYSRLGYDNSTYYFISARYLFVKKLLARISYSQVNYKGANTVEKELLPGLVYNIRDNLAVLAEYNYWHSKPANAPDNLLDRSMNLVINYSF